MSKFCSQCGSAISETDKFCPSCGAATDSVKSPKNTSTQSENNPSTEITHKQNLEITQIAQPESTNCDIYIKDHGIKELFFKKQGRLNRKRYILRCLILWIISLITLLLINADTLVLTIIGSLLLLGITLSYIMLTIRRCHDINHSGYFYLLSIIPIGNIIVFLMLYFKKGTSGPNKYGPDPLGTITEVHPNNHEIKKSEINNTSMCPFCQAIVSTKTKTCPLCHRNIKDMI